MRNAPVNIERANKIFRLISSGDRRIATTNARSLAEDLRRTRRRWVVTVVIPDGNSIRSASGVATRDKAKKRDPAGGATGRTVAHPGCAEPRSLTR